MSGLSASTYSWGGEAGRFDGGVSSFVKYFVMGALVSKVIAIDSSSVDGAEDNEEESEDDMLGEGGGCGR
jgi:hypothetical protein